MNDETPVCEMTMSDEGRVNGVEHYWQCKKPAKAVIEKRPRSANGAATMLVCGVHARAHDKIAKRYGFKLSEPIKQ